MRPYSTATLGHDLSSSPDPLASSPTENADASLNSRRALISGNRKQGPRRHDKQRTSLDNVSILPPSSPSRTVTEQTLSPWKIRVTVEAEPEHEGHAPIQTVTRTMKIPLREEDSPTQPASERSQPRARKGSVSRTRRRSATPTTERLRRQSVTDLDIIVLGDDADEDEWGKAKTKVSPRKTRAKKDIPQPKAKSSVFAESADFEVRPDTDAENELSTAAQDDSPELRQIDLNKVSIRSRANSVKQKSSHYDEEEDPMPQSVKPLPGSIAPGRRTVSANSAMSYPTPSPNASERGQSVEVEAVHEHAEGFDTIMESEGFTMIDLDSIPSVKQMLSSPPGGSEAVHPHRSQLSTVDEVPEQQIMPTLTTSHSPPQINSLRAIPPYLILPEGESDISCTVSSSPPTFQPRPQITRQVTPLSYLQVPAQPRDRQVTPQPYASPKLPSPPRPSASKDRSTPDSAKAMRAGLALQGALEPAGLNLVVPFQSTEQSKVTGHTRSSSDEIFDGFDSSTKRELRAGLRFGEELAKRQVAKSTYQELNVQKNRNSATQILRGESVISRTPVQTLAEQGRKIHGTAFELEDSPAIVTDTNIQIPTIQQENDLARQREHEWQLERDATSRQIRNADPESVVVVDSDSEDARQAEKFQGQSPADVTMDDDDGDIWLEEAKESPSSPRQASDESTQQFSQLSYHDETRENAKLTDKPRRSVIPSPWKRGEEVQEGNNSTMMTNGEDMSGLFWKQPQTQQPTFGAAAISNIRREYKQTGDVAFMARRGSGTFDIEKMLNTPKRIRDSLEREQSEQSARSNGVVAMSVSSNIRSKDEVAEIETVEDETGDAVNDGKSLAKSHRDLQVIPVNFNDSTHSRPELTPPHSARSQEDDSPPAARPPTPRSAMKGSRQSFGAVNGPGRMSNTFDQESRRVIFAERSKGVNVDWVENSSSVQLSSEDGLSSPIVEHQKHHGSRQTVQALTVEPVNDIDEVEMVQVEDIEVKDTHKQEAQGWLGWFWKNKANESNARPAQAPQTDGSSEQSPSTNPGDGDYETIHHASSSPSVSDDADRNANARVRLSEQSSFQIPSYLLPPSYPSDPARDPQLHMLTSGPFTNTHFRTLHILHRKSQRPRFHAPKLSACRAEICNLVAEKWKLEVDESDAGLGGFAWVVGETEARVLERFCREVEYSSLTSLSADQTTDRVRTWLGAGGIWSGRTPHGGGEVKWFWTATELATWLGRIVVGEVVREEEFGGSKYVS